MVDFSSRGATRNELIRARNRRTGIILASIALVFFIGIIVKYTVMR